jgi:hypothetical protein
MIRTEHGRLPYATVLQFWPTQPVTDVTDPDPTATFLRAPTTF